MDDTLIREPAMAGQFYPADPAELTADIDTYLEKTVTAVAFTDIKGLIVPHAGYMFSGGTAAAAYGTVTGKTYRKVIIIAPSHREYFSGVSVFGGAGYRTPLGVAATDPETAAALAAEADFISVGNKGHGQEHSLEVQIPFLQKILPGVPVVPMVMGEQNGDLCRQLAKSLVRVLDGCPALVVASTDLSHFHAYDTARSLDAVVNDRINAFDPEGLLDALADGRCEACGGGPAAAALFVCREMGATAARVVKTLNSGDIIEDKEQVVGYTAAVIYNDKAAH